MVQDCVFTCTDMRILDSGRQPAVLERWLPFVNIPGIKIYQWHLLPTKVLAGSHRTVKKSHFFLVKSLLRVSGKGGVKGAKKKGVKGEFLDKF